VVVEQRAACGGVRSPREIDSSRRRRRRRRRRWRRRWRRRRRRTGRRILANGTRTRSVDTCSRSAASLRGAP